MQSMTGFGRAQVPFQKGKITVEIKTVNHKFFDATLKLPNSTAAFEDKIKEILQKKVRRGKVNLNLAYDDAFLKGEKITINKKAARSYYNGISELKRHLGLKDDVGIKDIMMLPGVVSYDAADEEAVSLWPKIKAALDKALDRLVADRAKEGKSLCADLGRRVGEIGAMLSVIKSRAHLNIEEYRKKFADRVKELTSGRDIDMGRLEMEVAIFAKNSDISEEVTRLENHLANLKKTISDNGEIGKKLDFIAQELHREINTIGAKASDFKISKNVIEIKGEIEKIREQAKNLE